MEKFDWNKNFSSIQPLLEDESFEEKLGQCKDVQEMLALFAANGAELTEQDLRILGQYAVAAGSSGELSEEELEQAAGGIIILPVLSSKVAHRIGKALRLIL